MAEAVSDDTLETIAVDPKNIPSVLPVVEESKKDIDGNREGTLDSVNIEDNTKKDFECVDLDDGGDNVDGDDEDDDNERDENIQKKKRLKKKKPKHIVIDDDSSSDEERNGVSSMEINPSDLTWMLWMWYYITAASSGALKVAEYLGEKLATFFGITTPKYQYVLDEYYRLKELEREEEEKEQKERELLAERKMKDLSQLEGGEANLELNKEMF